MNNKHYLTLKHIINNKKIIISVLALGSVIILLSIVEVNDNGNWVRRVKASGKIAGLSFDSQENVIKPRPNQLAEAVISEGNFDFTATCDSYLETAPTTSTDAYSKQTYAPILMYHYIEDPGSSTLPWLFLNTDIFEAQIKTLKKNCYQTFFMREVAESALTNKALPKKNVTLTFDDGYADWYYNVLPLLKKYQVKATMFVIVNAIGTPGYLTKEQMKEMIDSGYVEFGSHTLNHANVRDASWQKAHSEIVDSKKKLEQITGQTVYSFAYPFGFFTERDEQICKEAGYLACASTYPGDIQTYDKRYSFYRLRPGYRIADDFMNWFEKTDHFKLKY